MKTLKGLAMVVAVFSLWGCEMDDVYFQDFLNDMTVDLDDGEDEAVCGDGQVDPGEACDDGNTWDMDGCSSYCTWEDSGCYDQYGWYRFMGESWSYFENEECYCYGYGDWACWGEWYEEEGCEVDGIYYMVDETFEMDGNLCTCLGRGALGCYPIEDQEVII